MKKDISLGNQASISQTRSAATNKKSSDVRGLYWCHRSDGSLL